MKLQLYLMLLAFSAAITANAQLATTPQGKESFKGEVTYGRPRLPFSNPLAQKGAIKKERLDSTVIYEYNEATQQFDLPLSKTSYSYTPFYLVREMISYSYRASTKQWEPIRKSTIDYDDQHREKSYLAEQFGTDGSWNFFYKEEYQYESDQLMRTNRFKWLAAEKEWLHTMKIDMLYDNNIWVADSTTGWFTSENQWRPFEKRVYEYNEGYLKTSTHFYWQKEDDYWKENYLTTFHRTPNKRLAAISYRRRNHETQDWVLLNVKSFNENTDNELVQRQYATWDDAAREWISKHKEVISHDFAINGDELVVPDQRGMEEPTQFHHKVSEILTRVEIEGSYADTKKQLFYYAAADSPTPVLTPAALGVRIYPNPAVNVLHVELNESDGVSVRIQLYDLQGHCVLEDASFNGGTIDISALNKGLYLCRITQNGRFAEHKLMVR